jgi:phage virion morphogenesis protein
VIGAQLIVNDKEVRGRLRAVALKIGDRRLVNRQLAAQLYAETMRNFATESFDGVPWAPLQKATVKAKAKKGYERILQNTGALRQSFLPFSDNDEAGVGALSTREHAELSEIHQYGAPARNIPARPMLPGEARARGIALEVYDLFVARNIK